MHEALSYAALLRPIGQMLEALRIDSFAVRLDSEGFIIRDKTRNRVQLTPRERAFLAELQSIHSPLLDKEDARRLAAGVIEWHLTEDDLERLEQVGRDRRRDPEQTPDSHSVSHILRIIGTILDQKRGQMFYVSKDDQIVTLEYTTSDGQKASEEFNIPMLYDCWVRLYKKRTARNGLAHLSA
ncbi:MAG TPA: hypothetical protein VHV54_18055 [Candidatus Binatia bacterium]|jgi:hypothetical protein|nr:hypothetical protein [Candidatus Binatia bacterium]